ncbi:MAG: family 20 glycosylhydrolase [Prevotella sp.]|jgi:hexosaminidase|nr:family 20 glycosylhydrolase [Prevotella sp.]
MKRNCLIIPVFLAELLFVSFDSQQKAAVLPVSLVWEMGANGVEPGYYENTFYIKNTGKTSLDRNWAIYYNQSPVTPANQKDAPLRVERIMSTYFKISPASQYQAIPPGETLAFTFRCKGGIIKESAAPQGTYMALLDENGNEKQLQNIPLEVIPFTRQEQWTRPSAKELPYPDGNYAYEQNALFNKRFDLDETALFPSLKFVEKTQGTSSFSKNIRLKYDTLFENEAELLTEKLESFFDCHVSATGETVIELKKPEHKKGYGREQYEIIIADNRFELIGEDTPAVFYACQTLLNLLGNAGGLPAEITNRQILDFPDTEHRGFMLDVARNFTTKKNLLKLIDILSLYKINVLHLHLTDDEGWRIEIPGLEELTRVGARRGHTSDESACLYPAFAWGWDASDELALANGYYSRADFIEILQYAKKRHIRVIPEVDLPGHSRAAIKSMNARYKKYIAMDKFKAEEYLLIDFADTSRYLSAQSFTDNVINVALPSACRFVEKVVDEIDKMYTDAGLELKVFHIGGDEVPHGSWEGSMVCRDFMKDRGMTKIRELKDHFLEQITTVLSKRNIQTAAWEDVALLPNDAANERFAGSNILSYCWNTVPEWKGDEVPYKLANAGYPVVLCNVTNLYMDMAYNKHQQEPGLYWGGFVNEYNSFDMLPYDIYRSVRRDFSGAPIDLDEAVKKKIPLSEDARRQIKGLQGVLWTETIRNFEQIEYCLFPKMFGLIERAWNIQPAWSLASGDSAYEEAKQLYNAQIAEKELPRLSKLGINFRVAQPGIKMIDGKLHANTTIPGAVIRYSTDGSEPTEQSIVWEKPVVCDAKRIKAKAFYSGKKSVSSLLVND